MVTMSLLYKWALLEEKQRKERSEQHAYGLRLAVESIIAEDKQRKQIEENARRLAEWAESLPKPPTKQKDISLLDVMFS
jgi:hypothetical protein